jgi:phosphoglucosamine mutase
LARYEKLGAHFGVVGTLMSNLGLELAMKERGIGFVRANVGDRYVMEALKKANWTLGGESSGHIVDLGLTTTGDGIITALQVLRVVQKTGRSLVDLKSDIPMLPQVLINVRVDDPKVVMAQAEVCAAEQRFAEALGDRGRILLRASGTEPLVRVMVEGQDAKEIAEVAEALADEVMTIAAG